MRRLRGDNGAATSILLIIMALTLVAATLLLSRIARANNLRTRAQTGADASALAAAAEIRDRGAMDIVRGLIPIGEIYKTTSDMAAREYAQKNGSVVDSVHASGFFGYTVKVTVHTKACEPNNRDQAPMHFECKPGEEGNHGTATAIAHVSFPMCSPRGLIDGKKHGKSYVPPRVGLFCAGSMVGSYEAARRLFAVRLVDEEDSELFSPIYLGRERETGKHLADLYGWTGPQWVCLNSLWSAVSGWNPFMVNPTTGGYGIPGSAGANASMARYGADYSANPVTQIRGGFDYISTRYVSPCAAYAFWLVQYPYKWY